MGFDIVNRDSTFLNFVAKESVQPQTAYRRLLANPLFATILADDWGFKTVDVANHEPLEPSLEYRFFTFYGVIGFFVMINRNTSPPRVAFFNGQLQPLDLIRQSAFGQTAMQIGPHFLAHEILQQFYCARELSMYSDAPFVEIAFSSTRNCSYFSGFSFSTSDFIRVACLNKAFQEHLDALFQDAELRLAARMKGPSIALVDYPLQQLLWHWRLLDLSHIPVVKTHIFTQVSKQLLNNERIDYAKIASHYSKLKKLASQDVELQILTELAQAWRRLDKAYQPKNDDDKGY